VGSGARAMGMGGAFIAIADDATAASWNPGGLMQLERPEFSFVFTFDQRRRDMSSSPNPEADSLHELYREDLNYFSVAYPFRAFNKNMIISLNYQRLYDLYDKMDFNYNYGDYLAGFGFYNFETRTRFRQAGSIKALAPAFAIQITPQFSFGITFNIWTDDLGFDNEWNVKRDATGTMVAFYSIANKRQVAQARSVYREENDNFEGFNVNIGFLWDITRVVTLGAVLKTPFTADIDRETYTFNSTSSFGVGTAQKQALFKKDSIEIDFPLSYGIGLAFRLSDKLTCAVDIYRTHWSDFWVKGDGGSSSPITGKARRDSHVHDTTQVRIGCEYLFVLERTIIPLRLGAFYDPSPSEKAPDDYFGCSIGTGIMLYNRILLDCAYIYRWGRDVGGDMIGLPGTDYDVDQHQLYISMIYHF